MNRFIFIGLLLFIGTLLLDLGSRALALDTRAVFETTLDNGLKVIFLENHKAPVVTVQVWYVVGARDEPLGKSGLTHLVEHLMFRGTARYGPKMFSRVVQKNGGQDNAFTSRDYTVYYENLAADRVGIALELEADRMANLLVDEQKFLTELQVVQEERRLRIKDDPVASLYEEINAVAFKSHPYQRPVIGWMEDLEGLTHRDFQDFYKTYYQPGNAVLVVAGDFQRETLLPLLQKTFGRVPAGKVPPRIKMQDPPQEAEKRITIQRQEARLPYVAFAFHVPAFPHPDAFALEVMSQILAGGKSSRLYRKMVYEEQQALEVDADFPFNSQDPHLFYLAAQAMPGKTPDEIERRLQQELEEWERRPPAAEEIDRAKNRIEAGFIFSQDSVFSQALILAKYQVLGKWQDIDQFIPGIRAVTQKDLLRVYQTYFQPGNRTVGVLIPARKNP
ncbi:MAG: insulinase family protein [Deltaproteobacteria bacterium]|nr:insulinase family protein [Deltaproteobacteria bacterium]